MAVEVWNLAELASVEKNGLKVFSTFACGGGSSMGYKRAGYDVIGANDIDPVMAEHYKANLNPKHYFLCPIKELITADLPDELFNLDILDGSPPCSSFSMAGNREKDWGKDKHFREGQAEQVLDDLFFDFLNLAERLQPRVIVAENVKGMLAGNARGYVSAIMRRLKGMGYTAQLFLINAADCGVPQTRERVFFVASREDVPKLVLAPSKPWVSCSEAVADLPDTDEKRWLAGTQREKVWHMTKPGSSMSESYVKLYGSPRNFHSIRLDPKLPASTITGQPHMALHWAEARQLTFPEAKRLGSFPDDYWAQTDQLGKYMIGMSVPPLMIQYVAEQIAIQWLTGKDAKD